MTSQHDEPTLSDVIQPTEQATPDHREHGKTNPHPNDEYLQARAEHEQEEVDGEA